jgi:hypothetical protein
MLIGICVSVIAALMLPMTAAAVDSTQSTSSLESKQSASERWQHHAEVGFDAAVLRPLGLIALVVGGAFVLPVALFTWPSGPGTFEAAVERFVTTPAEELFRRPLGEF